MAGHHLAKDVGGKDGEGVYEYLLNESLARRGGPQIGKGVGIVGKTIIRHGSEKLKAEFLPKILRNEVEFAVGYSEPNAGSDAASMRLKATRDGDGWVLNGQKTWTTSAHFAEWYWMGARTDSEVAKHFGITLFLVPLDHPNITIKPIWTMGDERTNEVYLDDVWISDDYVVGELNRGSSTSPKPSTSSASRSSLSRPSSSASNCCVTTWPTRNEMARRSRTIRSCANALPNSSPRPRSLGCSALSSCTSRPRAVRPPRLKPRSTSCTPRSCPSDSPTPRWIWPARAAS